MDDDNRKDDNPGASTSKRENKERENKEKDTKDGDFEDRERDDRSYTESSSEYSTRSRTRKDAHPQPADAPKMATGKGEGRRKRVRRGRVVKRRRSKNRRLPVRRGAAARRRPQKRERDREPSVSTIFTRLSSRSGSERSCTHCGHRCCGRRVNKIEKRNRRTYVKKVTRELRKMRNRKSATDQETVSLQVGSAAKVLSPLFITTNASIDETFMSSPGDPTFAEITPDMIYETIQKLSMWTHIVPLRSIMEYMKSTYPVNPNLEQLTEELKEKLNVAVHAGIIFEEIKDNIDKEKGWCLKPELMQRGLTKNHVTLFWKLYADTMSPNQRGLRPNRQGQHGAQNMDTSGFQSPRCRNSLLDQMYS